MGIPLTIGAITLCLIAEAFFSGSEIGIVSADPIQLRHRAAKGSRGARLALKMLDKPEWLLSTTLVGTNLAVVANTTIVTLLALQLVGPRAKLLAIAVVAPLIWIFGEIVPKSVFQQKADQLTPIVIYPLRAASILFSPLLALFAGLSWLITRAAAPDTTRGPFTLREQLESMMQMSATEGDIQLIEKKMIRRLFGFGETTAREIMVPWVEVAVIEQDARCGDAIRMAVDSSHRTLPVYAERVDRVVGVLDTLELLGRDTSETIRPYIRPVDYIPGSKKIDDLLVELRDADPHLSVVVDEYGGAEGIVTIEDIVEEVVEEIEDEFDEPEEVAEVRKLGERHYVVSARIELDELNTALGLELPEGEYATLAGFLLDRVEDIPQAGHIIRHEALTFTVQRATPQAIQEVRIRW